MVAPEQQFSPFPPRGCGRRQRIGLSAAGNTVSFVLVEEGGNVNRGEDDQRCCRRGNLGPRRAIFRGNAGLRGAVHVVCEERPGGLSGVAMPTGRHGFRLSRSLSKRSIADQ